MSGYEELRAVTQAKTYGLASKSKALATQLEGTNRNFKRIAAEVGIGARTGAAASASAAKNARTAAHNADALGDAGPSIDDANEALRQAKSDFDALPSIEVPQGIAAGMLGGGSVLLGPAGTFTGAVGLAFLGAVLNNKREREAIAALERLEASLAAAAAKLSSASAALEVSRLAEPTEIPDIPGDRDAHNLSHWELGVEWLSGRGNHRDFLEGDAFTEMLREHPFYDQMRKDLRDLARDGRLQVGMDSGPDKVEGDFEELIASDSLAIKYALDDWQGVSKYLADYSTLLTGGNTGNLAVTFLGSHEARVKVIGENPDGSYEVQISVTNDSSLQSATRIPKIGYEQWYLKTVGKFWDGVSDTTGIGKTASQTITWTETIPNETTSTPRNNNGDGRGVPRDRLWR